MQFTNRWAVSALSRENKASAVNDELMVHKDTAQMLLKRPDGTVISFDSISRFNTHKDIVESTAQTMGLTGVISMIDFVIELPSKIQDGINLLEESVLLSEDPVSKLLVSLDMDCLEIAGGEAILLKELPNVEILLTVGPEGSETQINKIIPLNLLRTTVISLPDNQPVSAVELKITSNPLSEGKEVEYILHSVLLIIE